MRFVLQALCRNLTSGWSGMPQAFVWGHEPKQRNTPQLTAVAEPATPVICCPLPSRLPSKPGAIGHQHHVGSVTGGPVPPD